MLIGKDKLRINSIRRKRMCENHLGLPHTRKSNKHVIFLDNNLQRTNALSPCPLAWGPSIRGIAKRRNNMFRASHNQSNTNRVRKVMRFLYRSCNGQPLFLASPRHCKQKTNNKYNERLITTCKTAFTCVSVRI